MASTELLVLGQFALCQFANATKFSILQHLADAQRDENKIWIGEGICKDKFCDSIL